MDLEHSADRCADWFMFYDSLSGTSTAYPQFYGVPTDMNDGSVVLIPRTFSMENISLAWQMLTDYIGSLAVTLLAVTTATVLQTLCCLLAGYGFARFDIPLKRLLFAMVILQ